MRTRVIGLFIIAALIVASPAFAQRGGGGRGGNSYTPTGPFEPHDLSGVWRGGNEYMGTPAPPMTAWGKAQFDAAKQSYGPTAGPPALGKDPLRQDDPRG